MDESLDYMYKALHPLSYTDHLGNIGGEDHYILAMAFDETKGRLIKHESEEVMHFQSADVQIVITPPVSPSDGDYIMVTLHNGLEGRADNLPLENIHRDALKNSSHL